jgi:outer membrane protein OmpA-like peptidoglycan-associated protein
MKTRFLLAVSAFALALGVTAAKADEPGLYLGAGAGINFANDLDVSNGNELDSDLGWAGIGTIGFRFGNGLRSELEGGYRFNDGNINGVSANTKTWNAMANLLYDLETGTFLEPYIGAGVGAVNTEMANDAEWAFAYQGIAGLAFEVNDWVEPFIDYRYLGTAGLDTDPLGNDLDDEMSNHTILAGVRVTLWQPRQAAETPAEPAPAPAPVSQAPQCGNYIVFFEFDSAELTPEAINIIGLAANAAKQSGTCKITVTGHTDTSGSKAYNESLSQRRAQAVAGALIGDGVAEGDIVVLWRGEAQPLVPTGDGVKEAQNRRVTIDMI